MGESTSALLPGDRLGPYEILGSLGVGGMGEVFRARDTRLGRDVAVKVLPPSFASDPERQRRFELEARAVAALDHPNVLVVHDVGAHDGREYIVTELLEGESLREKLEGGRIPPRKAVEIAIQVARGLSAAHEKGIVHRDLKPDNIFLTRDGRAKVIDFGLARVDALTLDSEGETQTAVDDKTAPGVLLGTVTYMSPEQARGRPAGVRSDVFALGAILYEMLAGRRPFSGATLADTLSAILREDPPPIESSSVAFPSTLDRVVRRCLEKEPAERFQTAGDVGFALEALTQMFDATGSDRATWGPPPAAKNRARGAALSWRSGVAFVALGAIGAVAARWLLAAPSAPRIVNYRALTGGANGEIVAFATDGERVYFTLRGGLETRQVALNGGASAPLALPFAGGYVLDASKTRSSLLMQQDEGAWDGSLWSVPLPAGGARKLGIEASGAAWSPDGQQLAFVRWKLPSQLATARGDGSKAKVLYESQDHLWGAAWSPDGQRLRFGLEETDTHHYWIMEIPATGGVPRRLFRGFGGDWSTDDKTFIFTNRGTTTGWENSPGTGAGGRLNLFAAMEPRALHPWAAPQIEQLTFGPLHVRGSAFGRGGRGLVVLAADLRRRLMRFDAKASRFVPLFGGLQGGFLDYSWDGHSVAWVDANDLTLWRSRSDGTAPMQLTTTSLAVGMVRWSPDGRKLAFVGKPDESLPRIYVVSSDGGAPEPISPPEKGEVWDPGWLPDGKTVVWGLVDAGGIRAFDLEKKKLSVLPGTDDLFFPKCSRQGLILVVTKTGSASDTYWTYDAHTGHREDLGLPNSMSYPNFTRDGQWVIGCSSALGISGFSLRDRRLQRIAALDSIQTSSLAYGTCWVGLDPEDSPIIMSDASTYELYALDWERP
jgi:Tol biopolymer transport system component